MNRKDVLKAAKSDESLNSSYKAKRRQSITFEDPQNLVIISTGKFCFYIILIFLIGMITGMIFHPLNPQDIKLD